MLKILIFLISIMSAFSVFSKTLIITDSHGEGTFGKEIVKLIEHKKESVSIYAAGGSTPKDWVFGLELPWGYWEYHTGQKAIRLNRPTVSKFDDILAKVKPQTVVIVQGTNLIWREHLEQDKEMIKQLIASTKSINAKCYWVGSPDLDPRAEFQKLREIQVRNLLETEINSRDCELISSWEFTHYPEGLGDGIHYDEIPRIGAMLARDWARSISDLIN